MSAARLPSDAVVLERLTPLLADGAPGPVAVVERKPHPGGSFPKEIVTVRRPDGRTVSVFCKYSAERPGGHGHRAGVAYESRVYERILCPSGATAPRLLGSGRDPVRNEEWLVLEVVAGSKVSGQLQWMEQAAAWIGRFHRLSEPRARERGLDGLLVYDTDYYAGWARRTSELAGHRRVPVPWLAELCRRFEHVVPLLLDGPTVVHGEYYPDNILVRDGTVFPVDWESAAIGAGEIDLACLTEGWKPEAVEAFTRAYARTRWPDGPPETFARRLAAAGVYVQLRWLGDRAEWTAEAPTRRFDRLEAAARPLGLLETRR